MQQKITQISVAPEVHFANGKTVKLTNMADAKSVAQATEGAIHLIGVSYTFGDGESIYLGAFPPVVAKRIVTAHAGDVGMPDEESSISVPSMADETAGAALSVAVSVDQIGQYITIDARRAYEEGQIELSHELATPAILDAMLCDAVGQMPWVQKNGYPGVWGYEVSSRLGQEINSVLLATGNLPTESEIMETLAAGALAFFAGHGALNDNPACDAVRTAELVGVICQTFNVEKLNVAFAETGVTVEIVE